MKSKIYFFVIIFFTYLFIPVTSIFAMTSTQTGSISATLSPEATGTPARIAAAKKLCDSAITKRIETLNGLSDKLGIVKKLTDTQKSTFKNQISTAVAGLTALKSKCAADTDFAVLKIDFKNIFTQYRIYTIQAPQIHLLVAADMLMTTGDQLTDVSTTLQTRIKAAGSPANLVSLFNDMQAKIEDAKKQAGSVISSVSSLTPDSYNADQKTVKAALTAARAAIKTGAADLRTATADAKQIRTGLKSIVTPGPVLSASVSPTVTPKVSATTTPKVTP